MCSVDETPRLAYESFRCLPLAPPRPGVAGTLAFFIHHHAEFTGCRTRTVSRRTMGLLFLATGKLLINELSVLLRPNSCDIVVLE